jgi:RNA polymerase sigma factor (sigma-70 family)
MLDPRRTRSVGFTANIKDARLVARTLANNTDAFNTLIHKHMPAVFAVSMSYSRNYADADDIAQEAFLKAWQSLDTLKEPRRFGGWVVTIARNVARTHYNRTKRDSMTLEQYKTEVDAVQNLDLEEQDDTMQNLVATLLSDLSESDRELVFLRYEGGRKTREIAELLQTSHATIRKRLERVRAKLGQDLLASLEPDSKKKAERKKRATRIASTVIATTPAWSSQANAALPTSSLGISVSFKVASTVVLLIAAAVTGYFLLQGQFSNPTTPILTNEAPGLIVQSQSDPELEIDIPAPQSQIPPTDTELVSDSATDDAVNPTGLSISGRMYEEDTGQGVESATILLITEGTWERVQAQTDSDGQYAFNNLEPASYRIRPDRDDDLRWRYPRIVYDNQERKLQLEPDASLSDIDFTAHRGLTVQGKVLGPDGNPLQGALVKTWDTQRGHESEIRTDAEGRFTLNGFGTDAAAMFWPLYGGLALPPHGPVTVPATGLENLTLTMIPESRISGFLLDEYGTPLPNARILPWPKNVSKLSQGFGAKTDQFGRFDFDGLHESTYRFSVRLENETSSNRLTQYDDLELAQGEHLKDLKLIYEFPGNLTIKGRVTHHDGRPVKQRSILGYSGRYRGSATTDDFGYYELHNLAPGTYTVGIEGWRRMDGSPYQTIMADAGSEKANIVFPQHASIQGNVVDADTGDPVPEFEIRYSTNVFEWVGFRNKDGEFFLPNRSPGERSFSVRAKGYAHAQSGIIVLLPGQELRDVLIELSSAGIVSGTVFDPEGNPLRDATIGSRIYGILLKPPRSDMNGKFEIAFPAGTSILTAWHPQFSHAETEITVAAGESLRVDLHMQNGAQLTGTVTMGGDALKGVRIELYKLESTNTVSYSRETHTDNEGPRHQS